MNDAPWFVKYVGIQGLLALLLIVGYVYAAMSGITLPEGYTEIATLILGYYFAKNGVGIVSAIRG